MIELKKQTDKINNSVIDLPSDELLNQWLNGEVVSEVENNKNSSINCYEEYHVYMRYQEGC